MCGENGYLGFTEAMHLLPQSFEFRRPTPPPKGRLSEQRRSSSQLLFGSFRKACRTSSRGRLFRFRTVALEPESELRFLPALFGVERRQGDPEKPHRTFEREHRDEQGLSILQDHVDV